MKTLYHLAVLFGIFFCQDLSGEEYSFAGKFGGYMNIDVRTNDYEERLQYDHVRQKYTAFLIRLNEDGSMTAFQLTVWHAMSIFPNHDISKDNYDYQGTIWSTGSSRLE